MEADIQLMFSLLSRQFCLAAAMAEAILPADEVVPKYEELSEYTDAPDDEET